MINWRPVNWSKIINGIPYDELEPHEIADAGADVILDRSDFYDDWEGTDTLCHSCHNKQAAVFFMETDWGLCDDCARDHAEDAWEGESEVRGEERQNESNRL